MIGFLFLSVYVGGLDFGYSCLREVGFVSFCVRDIGFAFYCFFFLFFGCFLNLFVELFCVIFVYGVLCTMLKSFSVEVVFF